MYGQIPQGKIQTFKREIPLLLMASFCLVMYFLNIFTLEQCWTVKVLPFQPLMQLNKVLNRRCNNLIVFRGAYCIWMCRIAVQVIIKISHKLYGYLSFTEFNKKLSVTYQVIASRFCQKVGFHGTLWTLIPPAWSAPASYMSMSATMNYTLYSKFRVRLL